MKTHLVKLCACLFLLAFASTATAQDVVLVSIGVTPINPNVPVGTDVQLTATGIYSDGSILDLTSQVSWKSGAPNVAKISKSPRSKGLVTGHKPGTAEITASFDGVSGSATLTVTVTAAIAK